MKEIMERERKKQSERDAEKAKKTEGKVDGCDRLPPQSGAVSALGLLAAFRH